MTRVYLDNAATSWPKPDSVYAAMEKYHREQGVAAGRGGYRTAEEVDRIVSQTRLGIAKLINADSSNDIIFTSSCTDSLNLALHGLLSPGDHVVTTEAEHNSILRPLSFLETHREVQFSKIAVGTNGKIDASQLKQTIQPNTKLVAITYASNVTGARQPVEEIAEIVDQHDCLLLVDAAQTIGHEPIDVRNTPIDLLAAPGHKGLVGPLGTGFLFAKSEHHSQLRSFRQGGTGTRSEQLDQPNEAPAKYEAGNLNVPGIVGLGAGVRYIEEHQSHKSSLMLELSERLIAAIESKPEVALHSSPNRSGIVSFNIKGLGPRELATTLDSMASIEVRAGLHCAPLMHRAIGTFELGGCVRVSFGHFSKPAEVDTLVEAIEAILANPIH